MAPKTLLTPEQVAEINEIARTGTDRTFGMHKITNGFANRRPKVNADIGSTTYDEDSRAYISDPWPRDWDTAKLIERERRVSQGQSTDPRKKQWTRSARRVKGRAQRKARKVMRRAAA